MFFNHVGKVSIKITLMYLLGYGTRPEAIKLFPLAIELKNDIGINIMNLSGPYYCEICDGIVTEKICPHNITNSAVCHDISGTDIRNSISTKLKINPKFVRESVIDSLKVIKEPFVR